MRRRFVACILCIVVVSLLGAAPRPAQALDAVVGDGTPGSCTEAAFDQQLKAVQEAAVDVGTYTITFDCGAEVTIPFSSEKVITADEIVIDGGAALTLSGGDQTRLFRVKGTGRLHLVELVLTDGYSGDDYGGAVYVEENGVFVMDKGVIRNSKTNGKAGGAIIDFKGHVSLFDSRIEYNSADYGALNSTGSLTVVRSILYDNEATIGGAAISAGGAVTIDQSILRYNDAPTAGAVYLTPTADVFIKDSLFDTNNATAADPAQAQGGAILSFANALLIQDSVFYGNGAGSGGAIFANQAAPQVTITGSDFSSNSAAKAGGAIFIADSSNLDVRDTRFDHNRAENGGGIYFAGTRLIMKDNYFTHNQAGDRAGALYVTGEDMEISGTEFNYNIARNVGGAIACFSAYASLIESGLTHNQTSAADPGLGFGGALYSNECVLNLSNLTFSSNKATGIYGQGAALFHVGGTEATMIYATFAENTAEGTLVNFDGTDNFKVSRSLFAGNSGGTCSGEIISEGYNYRDDPTCKFTQSSDKLRSDLPLAPTVDSGNGTSAYVPLPGNPAIDAIPVDQCAFGSDQRLGARPVGAGCDVGAIEVGSFLWRTYLPAAAKSGA